MFAHRRPRKPPKGGYQPPLLQMLAEAQAGLGLHGKLRVPAAPWLAAAELLLNLQRCCRVVTAEETAHLEVEALLAGQGLAWRWEEEDLVLELPGWALPKPRIIAVQPPLF